MVSQKMRQMEGTSRTGDTVHCSFDSRCYSSWALLLPSACSPDVFHSLSLLSYRLVWNFPQDSGLILLLCPAGILVLEKTAWQETAGDGMVPLDDSISSGCHPHPPTATSP